MHYYHLIFRSHSIFTSHPSNVLYSKMIQFKITPCITCQHLFICLLCETVLQSLFDFQDVGTFQDYIGQLFCRLSFFWGVCCFLMIKCKLRIVIWHYITSVGVHLLFVSYQVAHSFHFDTLLFAVHLDYLIKTVSATFLYCEITQSLLCFMWRYFEIM